MHSLRCCKGKTSESIWSVCDAATLGKAPRLGGRTSVGGVSGAKQLKVLEAQ